MTQEQQELLKTLCEKESILNYATNKCEVWGKYLQQMEKEKGKPRKIKKKFSIRR